MTRSQIAARLRELALDAENIEAIAMTLEARDRPTFYSGGGPLGRSSFTCKAVKLVLGRELGYAYRDALVENETALWDDPDCPSIRVLMLCFAAAMAETGDLRSVTTTW